MIDSSAKPEPYVAWTAGRIASGQVQHVIFDWDGTVVDSRENVLRSIVVAASTVKGPVISEADVVPLLGHTAGDIYRTLAGEQSPDARKAFLEAFADAYCEQCREHPEQVLEDARRLIADLRARSIKMSVATNKRRRTLAASLESVGMESLFQYRLDSDAYPAKPDPAMIVYLKSVCALPVEHMLMVGDSEIDRRFAEAGGCDFVLVQDIPDLLSSLHRSTTSTS